MFILSEFVRSIFSCQYFSVNLEQIFECLSHVIITYGEEVINCQLIPFVFQQFSDVSTVVTLRAVSGMLAALHMLKLSVILMTEKFLQKKFCHLSHCLKNIANIFMSPKIEVTKGFVARQMMASCWVETFVKICQRIGPEMTSQHALKTILAVFENAEKFFNRAENELASPVPLRGSPLTMPSKPSSYLSEDFYSELAPSASFESGPSIHSRAPFGRDRTKTSGPEIFTYSSPASESEAEFGACFDVKTLLSLYIPMCRVLGNAYMEMHTSRFVILKTVFEQQNDLSSDSSASDLEVEDNQEMYAMDYPVNEVTSADDSYCKWSR